MTPFPTRDANVTACTVGSKIDCAVIRPMGSFSCDNLKAPVETCPASSELLRAFMVYDGSFGQSVFFQIVCDESEFIAETIQSGGTAEFNLRASPTACSTGEATAIVYDSDPLNGGTSVGSSTIQLNCPGPWTLGATIAPGFTLDTYVSTTDNGLTFDYNSDEAQLELNFIGQNPGTIPLTITDGTITSSFGSGRVNGLPADVAPKNQQILQTQTGTVQLSGQSGQTLSFSQVLAGVSDNEFAIPCEATGDLFINL